ncbi:MAG: DUF87 domain-containing protein [Candidatus Tectomicrobia bacterium]|uniref:DUF87 domain-containing protein n=1 Tax=Tectimicrobiota bacterium TaxID=2528274 RepID=A0A932CPY2_UNCTE|nr:DUF87 domain-containing protein [Candidatus Tectomicrobia bacterium]
MSIQVNQVKGDIVELVFNPREDDLRVGENLCIRERESGSGLIVQIIEFRMVTYPALIREQLQLVIGEAHSGLVPQLLDYLAGEDALDGDTSQIRNLKIAIAKIRKLTGSRWDQWDGWIPTRDVEITRTRDEEVFHNCIDRLENALHLGQTLRGEPFFIEGQDLEKVNIITGVKGSGKSYLSKVILLELIERGAPCIVFDINKEYIHLPRHEVDPVTGRVLQKGIIHLKAGDNLKLGVRQFGLSPLMTMLTKYGLPEVSAMYLENRVFKLLEEMERAEKVGKKSPFVGIQHLIEMAEENEYAQSEVVNGAIRSRLEAVKNTGIFAAKAQEAISIHEQYQQIREGGALVIDVSTLSNLARYGFVQAIIEMVKGICETEIAQGTDRFPFVFFEEAHLYINKNTIGYIVTRSRHLGITSFFVTNMVGGLDETVLRQVDNLFLLYLPFEDDVRHIGKSAMTDQETISSFVRRLRSHHSLIIGNVTRQYPVIIKVKYLEGIHTAGETQYFFKLGGNGNGHHPSGPSSGNGRRLPRAMEPRLGEDARHSPGARWTEAAEESGELPEEPCALLPEDRDPTALTSPQEGRVVQEGLGISTVNRQDPGEGVPFEAEQGKLVQEDPGIFAAQPSGKLLSAERKRREEELSGRQLGFLKSPAGPPVGEGSQREGRKRRRLDEGRIEFDRVARVWKAIVDRIEERRAFLGFVLSTGRPIDLTGNVLSIAFSPTDIFHKEMLEKEEYRQIVEEELSAAVDFPVKIHCLVEKQEARRRG